MRNWIIEENYFRQYSLLPHGKGNEPVWCIWTPLFSSRTMTVWLLYL